MVQSKSRRIMRPAAELSPGHEAGVVGGRRRLPPRIRKGLPFSAAGMRDEMPLRILGSADERKAWRPGSWPLIHFTACASGKLHVPFTISGRGRWSRTMYRAPPPNRACCGRKNPPWMFPFQLPSGRGQRGAFSSTFTASAGTMTPQDGPELGEQAPAEKRGGPAPG